MTFISINTKTPLTRELAQTRGLANQAKTNVLDNAGQFHKLDKTEADKAYTPDEVMVNQSAPAELPKTQMETIRDKFKSPEELASEPKKLASGYTRGGKDGLAYADVEVKKGDSTQDFMYRKFDDGTEVYSGPTEGGYAVVRENSAQGTLFVELSDAFNPGRVQFASSPNFVGDPAVNDPEAGKPKTFGEAVKAVGEVTHTSGSGTYLEGVRQRTEVVKNLFGSLGGLFGRKG